MSAIETSLDALENVVINSTCKRIGASVPAYANVDAIILNKAAQLAAQGESVVVACATKTHARALAAQASAAGAPEANIAFAGDLALAELADPRVQEHVSRENRVLDANEMDILAEDVKVTGLKLGRLREMLKFFYRSISDCTAEKEDWLVTPEEATVFAVLEENLEARRACLPCEVAAKAYQGLIAASITPSDRIIIVDDFGALSASTQRLFEFLSAGKIIAFGNDAFLKIDDEPYPAPAGMAAFLADEKTESYFVAATSATKHPAKTLPTPHGEFQYVAGAIAQFIECGRAPEDFVVAVPGDVWARQIGKALAELGIKTFLDMGEKKIKGDPRDSASAANIKLHAFAKLLANPNDFTAYRTYLGTGDWLVRSDGFLELLAFARENNLSAADAVPALCEPENLENATVSFRKFLDPIQEYSQLQKIWETENVAAISQAMESFGMPLGEHAEALGDAKGKPNIQAFLNSFNNEQPVQPENAVIVAPYSRCHAHHAKVLFLTGMVDGFMPKRDAVDDSFHIDHRAKSLARDRALLTSIEAIAEDEILYSNFDHDALENVGALHMVATRIYQKDGRRMAQVSPSALLG